MTSSQTRQDAFSSAAKKIISEAPKIADPSGRSFVAFMDDILSKQDADTASEPSFADCGPDTQRMLLKEALRGYLQKLKPIATEHALSKLADEPRLDAFRELCLSKPDKLDELIKGVLTAYLESLMPDVRSMIQQGLKTYLQNLRASAKLLIDAFSMPVFERLPIPMAMEAEEKDRIMFEIHLEQALASIEYLDVAFDQHFAIIPYTRKKVGIKGRRTLFGLLAGEVFRSEFGTAQHMIVTELTDVLFELGTKKYKHTDAARSAENRWKKRRPLVDESKAVKAAIRVIVPLDE